MQIFNWLVTNQYSVRFSWALCRAWNAVTERGGRAEARRERNAAALSAYAGAGYINGQRRRPVALLPYGEFTMEYNGCEVIAGYNALRALGAPVSLGEAAAYFEETGLFLRGKWGTHVLAIPEFFRKWGFTPWTLFASRSADFDAAFAASRAAVFSFWNDPGRLQSGVHTVTIAHAPGGGLLVYNLHGGDFAPCGEYRSISELIRRTGVLPVLLVAVS